MLEEEGSLETAIEEFSEADRIELVRRQFEGSEEWFRHKQFHEEHGGQPNLRIWEVEAPSEQMQIAKQPIVDEPERHVKTVKVGGCDCQPRAFMELTDRGDVIAGIPVPIEGAKPYGVSSGGTATYGAAGSEASIYAPSSDTPDLYR